MQETYLFPQKTTFLQALFPFCFISVFIGGRTIRVTFCNCISWKNRTEVARFLQMIFVEFLLDRKADIIKKSAMKTKLATPQGMDFQI